MDKVLVTGGCGFIGSRIVNKLLEDNYQVHVIDNLSTGNINNIDLDQTILHTIDINDIGVEQIFKENSFRYVIHQAAQTSVPVSIKNISFDTKTNILGSVHLIELSKKYKVERFVFASSAAVYGNPEKFPITEDSPAKPTSPYGLSKYTVEQYLKLAFELYGLNYSILRYSNVYGPKQSAIGEGGVVSIFDQLFKQGKTPVIYGDGTQTRDFIYVDDVASANIASLKSKNGTYNISTNSQTSINYLYELISKLHSKKMAPKYETFRKGDIKVSVLGNKLACENLDWEPKTTLNEGLKKTILS